MELKPIQGAQPHIEDVDAVLADFRVALETGQLAQGPKIVEFEKSFAGIIGTSHCAGVSSGGSALELCLKALNVTGKEVLVPTNTFVATGNAVTLAGGTPVFIDVEPTTLCMDPVDAIKKITKKTAGLIYVPLFGRISPSVTKLTTYCRDNKLFFLEDAAHAHGSAFNGKKAGTFGIASCFSFFATKVVTTGEGGAITTSNSELYKMILQLRNHGKSLETVEFEHPSNNYRMDELSAILGIHQLKTLEQNVKRRNDIATQYRKGLGDCPSLQLLGEFEGSYSSYWRFPALLAPNIDRTKFQTDLWENARVRITWMYEPLCHLQPVFQKIKSYKKGDFPNAEITLDRLICLPTHGGLSDGDVDRVIEAVRMTLQ